jgi:hypothetical protein
MTVTRRTLKFEIRAIKRSAPIESQCLKEQTGHFMS